jgi:hypothetical protein
MIQKIFLQQSHSVVITDLAKCFNRNFKRIDSITSATIKLIFDVNILILSHLNAKIVRFLIVASPLVFEDRDSVIAWRWLPIKFKCLRTLSLPIDGSLITYFIIIYLSCTIVRSKLLARLSREISMKMCEWEDGKAMTWNHMKTSPVLRIQLQRAGGVGMRFRVCAVPLRRKFCEVPTCQSLPTSPVLGNLILRINFLSQSSALVLLISVNSNFGDSAFLVRRKMFSEYPQVWAYPKLKATRRSAVTAGLES